MKIPITCCENLINEFLLEINLHLFWGVCCFFFFSQGWGTKYTKAFNENVLQAEGFIVAVPQHQSLLCSGLHIS